MGKKVRVWRSDAVMLGNEEAQRFDDDGKPVSLRSKSHSDPGHWEEVDEEELKNNRSEGRDGWYDGVMLSKGGSGCDLYEESRGRFHIGQSYDRKPAVVIRCRKCRGTDFNVATGSYYTAIRCVKCKWEVCIHNG